jgi:hypothetical protein
MSDELKSVVEDLDVLLRGPPPVVGVAEAQWLQAVKEKATALQAAAPEKAGDIQEALTEFQLDPYTGYARLRDILEEIKPSVSVEQTPQFQEKVTLGPTTVTPTAQTPTAQNVELLKNLVYVLAGAAALALAYWLITHAKKVV